ncbi:hypothetical protein DERF_001586 [Dermatophagoides farinae]|uniref:Uncharacterized protein n=1 Tax=Dermatophagoides farinae TaxID=6954 RepID=A0A922IB49_DERFA|nr:hypothetical protein DERF_001586 [Dermatophagoides farinae]
MIHENLHLSIHSMLIRMMYVSKASFLRITFIVMQQYQIKPCIEIYLKKVLQESELLLGSLPL